MPAKFGDRMYCSSALEADLLLATRVLRQDNSPRVFYSQISAEGWKFQNSKAGTRIQRGNRSEDYPAKVIDRVEHKLQDYSKVKPICR